MGDENDVVFSQYSLDFFGWLQLFFEALFGGSGTANGGAGTAGSGSGVAGGGWSISAFVEGLSSLWTFFTVLSWLLSILLIFGLIYAYIRHGQLGLVETEGLLEQERLYEELHGTRADNQRWLDVEKHIASDNPNDWKLAIIEADVILEELLEAKGYAGNTVGDKLKSASAATFTTVDQAWRAHDVRNKIAHGRSDFVLTKKIAEETITQYKMVFQEFGVV